MSRIVVIGGHGKIAQLLARTLAESGHAVTSIIRNPAHSDAIAALGATPVVLDIESASTEMIGEHLSGADVVVFSAGAGGGNPARTYAVDRDAAIRCIDATAALTPTPRFVMVSYFGAGPDHGVPEDNSFFPYAEAKAAADQHLRASSVPWTIVAPGGLTDGPATGAIVTRAQGSSGGAVSRADVAAVLAAVIDAPASVGKTYEFVAGPTPIEAAVGA